jgi:hypothetical protein
MLVGHSAQLALSSARTLIAWETAERDGKVRITAEPDDEPYDFGDMTGRHLEECKAIIERLEKIDKDFLDRLCRNYAVLFQSDYDHHQSDEYIDEQMVANEYTFLKNGKRFEPEK